MVRNLEREVNLGRVEQASDIHSLMLMKLHRLLVLLSSMGEGEGRTSSISMKSQVFFDTVKGKMEVLGWGLTAEVGRKEALQLERVWVREREQQPGLMRSREFNTMFYLNFIINVSLCKCCG